MNSNVVLRIHQPSFLPGQSSCWKQRLWWRRWVSSRSCSRSQTQSWQCHGSPKNLQRSYNSEGHQSHPEQGDSERGFMFYSTEGATRRSTRKKERKKEKENWENHYQNHWFMKNAAGHGDTRTAFVDSWHHATKNNFEGKIILFHFSGITL